jgi:hypothetical protein
VALWASYFLDATISHYAADRRHPVRRTRHSVAYGSTNKYRPLIRSKASGSNATATLPGAFAHVNSINSAAL